ncbi:MAG: thiol-disulfide oxidoreductase DCC family protein [Bacteroidota bacterium]|nr:thiol-disulfide oxidoreductase DCC family protein [Bacteroidota bacterium]
MTETILLFDGVCNLCNGMVRFVLRHERNPTIQFASLQSFTGSSYLKNSAFYKSDLTSIIFIENQKTYVKSEAAFKIAAHLKQPWSWIRWLRYLPLPISDFFYDLIAKNRYRLFGKSDKCMVPEMKYLSRFVQ